MPERRDAYRQLRLVITPSPTPAGDTHWHLAYDTVRKGVPTSQIAQRGIIKMGEVQTTERAVVALVVALEAICDKHMLAVE
jgi:hypothetical protein